jgi:hypothetical protein
MCEVGLGRVLPVAFAFTCFLLPAASESAEIEELWIDKKLPLTLIKGEIVQGDDLLFDAVSAGEENAAVVFESPGGNLLAGIGIGRIISQKGYNTGVATCGQCASACALAWIAGAQRYMAPDALIGFHAAFTEDNGAVSVSSVGNALVGAYLADLGFSDQTIVFATAADPESIDWLEFDEASRLGLATTVLYPSGVEIESSPVQDDNLKLPSGFRWIVLASDGAPMASDLRRYRESVPELAFRQVKTKNGFYAIVSGPYPRDFAMDMSRSLSSRDLIPKDFYLSSGNGFVE